MQFANFLIVSALWSSHALADFKFTYGEEPRRLEVNSFEKTLLVFPSPPYTQVCQPSGVVALDTLSKLFTIGKLEVSQCV